jgi:hypothetical protein
MTRGYEDSQHEALKAVRGLVAEGPPTAPQLTPAIPCEKQREDLVLQQMNVFMTKTDEHISVHHVLMSRQTKARFFTDATSKY